MAAQYGVGRASVREAMRILELQGLVRVRPGKGGGPEVQHPGGRDLAEAMTVALQMQDTRFGVVSDAVAALGGTEAAMAAARAKGDRPFQKRLRDEVPGTLPADISDEDFLELSLRFHRLVREIAGNNVLAFMTDGLTHIYSDRVLTDRQFHWTRAEMAAIHSDHVAIAAAIQCGDVEQARRLGEAHMHQQTLLTIGRQPGWKDMMIDWE